MKQMWLVRATGLFYYLQVYTKWYWQKNFQGKCCSYYFLSYMQKSWFFYKLWESSHVLPLNWKTYLNRIDRKNRLMCRACMAKWEYFLNSKYFWVDYSYIWIQVFKNGSSKRPVRVDHNLSNFVNAVFHKFYLVHSWILCPKYTCVSNHIFQAYFPDSSYQCKPFKVRTYWPLHFFPMRLI